MRQVETRKTSGEPAGGAGRDAARIPALGHAEAAEMGAVELERFLALIEGLSPDDWAQPTACVRWDVRETVAHVAGSAAAFVDGSEFRRQSSSRAQRPYRTAGLSRLDAQNQIQVDDRAGASPAALIAELRDVGPRAVAARRRMPALVRALRLPLGLAYPLGRIWVPLGYMVDVIIVRDMWMHRLDVCRATGRAMGLTPEHDGRITALVVRDLARTLARALGGASVAYELSGPAGGVWRIGSGAPGATIRMDALDFHLLASGRMPPDEARAHAAVTGDAGLGMRALERTSVVY